MSFAGRGRARACAGVRGRARACPVCSRSFDAGAHLHERAEAVSGAHHFVARPLTKWTMWKAANYWDTPVPGRPRDGPTCVPRHMTRPATLPSLQTVSSTRPDRSAKACRAVSAQYTSRRARAVHDSDVLSPRCNALI